MDFDPKAKNNNGAKNKNQSSLPRDSASLIKIEVSLIESLRWVVVLLTLPWIARLKSAKFMKMLPRTMSVKRATSASMIRCVRGDVRSFASSAAVSSLWRTGEAYSPRRIVCFNEFK